MAPAMAEESAEQVERAVAAGRLDDYDAIWRDAYGDMQEVGPTHRHLRRLLAATLEPLSYRTAVEVGCGAGHNFSLLVDGRDVKRLTGVDVSTEALDRARARWPQAELHQLDIQREAPAGGWDVVLCSLVLEHLPDDEAALRNMLEMTDGHLVAATIAGNFERYRDWERQMGHVRNYARGELEGKLERAGFTVERTVYWGFPFYSPITRRLQNGRRSQAEFGLVDRLAASLMYAAYWLNSSRRGDLVVALARA